MVLMTMATTTTTTFPGVEAIRVGVLVPFVSGAAPG
jgi:hypothetical protein